MKISVITLHTISNYGSALQTYATQQILKNMGHEVEFIDYHRPGILPSDNVDRIFNSATMMKYKRIWNFNKHTYNLTKFLLLQYIKTKKNNIRKFIEKNIHLTEKKYFSLDELKNNPPEADIYLTGSDQVWNSQWNGGIDKVFFLDFASPEKPRIAFAASIGRTSFDEEEEKITKKLLEKYDFISMREQSGVDLLSKMGIDSQLILDPTLMLDKSAWKKLAKPVNITKKYLLIYQLNKNPQMDTYAEQLAKKENLEIIRLSYNISERKKAGKCIVKPTVEKFLGYFINAHCVLTDSFHATAFALNLGVDFISILPPRFSTRITNILALTKTEHRLLSDYSDFSIAENPIDKKSVDEILEAERKKGYCFLESAINKEKTSDDKNKQ